MATTPYHGIEGRSVEQTATLEDDLVWGCCSCKDKSSWLFFKPNKPELLSRLTLEGAYDKFISFDWAGQWLAATTPSCLECSHIACNDCPVDLVAKYQPLDIVPAGWPLRSRDPGRLSSWQTWGYDVFSTGDEMMGEDWSTTPESMMDDTDVGSVGGVSTPYDGPATPATEITITDSNSFYDSTSSSDEGEAEEEAEEEDEDDDRYPWAQYRGDVQPAFAQATGNARHAVRLILSWLEQPKRCTGPGSSPDSRGCRIGVHGVSSVSALSGTTPRRAAGSQPDDDEDDGSEPTQGVASHPHTSRDTTALLACPFWKHDRGLFTECSRYKLKRIRDVKQHLKRKHSDRFHCERCGFDCRTVELSESHCQSSTCIPGRYRRRWLSKTQRRLLTRRCRGSPEKQWYAMWDIIFPRETPPDSPFVADPEFLCEHMSSFRDFLETQGPEIVQQSGLIGSQGSDIAVQVREFLQLGLRVYDAWAANQGAAMTTPEVENQVSEAATFGEAQGLDISDQGRDLWGPETNGLVEQLTEGVVTSLLDVDFDEFVDFQDCL
ncbi:hypothetical protein B0T14DRAFT_489833 [Immersiella caudata]|uniref:Uncharacterized protein n=1 Tax=Immersiella caudata TaxID=314043 RepID=A0AA39XDL6_9PEZI|nr:hypothetical protein B0T14DRAFT_489833 [Immersiella caudata]